MKVGEIQVKPTPRGVAVGYCLWYIGINVHPGDKGEIKEVGPGYKVPLYSALMFDGGNIIAPQYEHFEVGKIYLTKDLKITYATPNEEIDKIIKERKIKFIKTIITELQKEMERVNKKIIELAKEEKLEQDKK